MAWRQPSQRGYLMAVLGFATLAAVLAYSIAAALNLPRPFMLGLSPAYIAHGARGSLPSAHAAVMLTTALLCLGRPALRGAGAGDLRDRRPHRLGAHPRRRPLPGRHPGRAAAGADAGGRVPGPAASGAAPCGADDLRDGPGRRAMASQRGSSPEDPHGVSDVDGSATLRSVADPIRPVVLDLGAHPDTRHGPRQYHYGSLLLPRPLLLSSSGLIFGAWRAQDNAARAAASGLGKHLAEVDVFVRRHLQATACSPRA